MKAYIALGANLGDPAEQLKAALAALAALPQTRLVQASSFYASAPVGFTDQPDFVNAVCELETDLAPLEVLAALLRIESENGRERSFKNSPRTLDLDLILYGEQCVDLPELSVPHPRMHQRAFVLLPLLEIAPAVLIPKLGAAQGYLALVADQALIRLGQSFSSCE